MSNKITWKRIAGSVGVSPAFLSEILGGKYTVQRSTAEKFADFTNRPFVDFMTMKPETIRRTLWGAARDKWDSN